MLFLFLLAIMLVWSTALLLALGKLSFLLPAGTQLQLPQTLADLGQSLSIVDGLLSAVAITLALWAVLDQRRKSEQANRLQTYVALADMYARRVDDLEKWTDNLIARKGADGQDEEKKRKTQQKIQGYMDEARIYRRIGHHIRWLIQKENADIFSEARVNKSLREFNAWMQTNPFKKN